MGMDEKNERNERRRMGVMGVDRNGWEEWEWMGAMRTDGHAGRAAAMALLHTEQMLKGKEGQKKPSLGRVSFGWFYFLR